MSTIPETTLNKVRALLAKAEAASTDAERFAYTAKANELMARYSIDAALLAAKQGTTDTPIMKSFTITNPRALAKARLLMSIANNVRCKALRSKLLKGRVFVDVYGYPTDIERVEILYTSLLLQMANGLESTLVPYSVDARSFRRSWLIGFALQVGKRLAEIEQAAEDDTTPTEGQSTALVLRDRSKALIDLVNGNVPKTNIPKRAPVDPHGYKAGKDAADQADLGQTRVTTGHLALTS
ncbi:DUF2786 domain-containing protein [Nocardiopsis sp. CT-R113]|uniref:DUF2786 domain-containing protein n=1 Tax=Nocardiopsis codii TaxID=3065942 RepID=A0ABU7KCY8_9ACTN|nr:DUF2786 domain-containing protein [Nocardiopsis sp. CT-R113]MEE2040100.1 DUF2786 domain-containing protein [Nocardiopsis sp. CT-R113]